MNISQQQISYIISLLEHKNFGKAADACFVTQPTLSMQVKKAEDSLGYKIFNRNINPLVLTEFGEKLLPILYELQVEYDKILHLSKESEGKMLEEIKIGVIPTIASYLVPELFQHKNLFTSNLKWAIKELKTAEILDQIQSKKIDLGILAGPLTTNLSENLKVLSLYNEEILIYSNQELDQNKMNKIHISELKNAQPWLLNNGNCLRTQMIHFCKLSDSPKSDWNYEGGNLEMLIKMVDINKGYTLIPDFYQKAFSVDKSKIKHIYSEHANQFPARNIIGICSHKNSKKTEINELFNFIKVKFANQDMKKFDVLEIKL